MAHSVVAIAVPEATMFKLWQKKQASAPQKRYRSKTVPWFDDSTLPREPARDGYAVKELTAEEVAEVLKTIKRSAR